MNQDNTNLLSALVCCQLPASYADPTEAARWVQHVKTAPFLHDSCGSATRRPKLMINFWMWGGATDTWLLTRDSSLSHPVRPLKVKMIPYRIRCWCAIHTVDSGCFILYKGKQKDDPLFGSGKRLFSNSSLLPDSFSLDLAPAVASARHLVPKTFRFSNCSTFVFILQTLYDYGVTRFKRFIS